MSSEIQLTVTVVEGPRILVGFSNENFSQAVYIPFTDVDGMRGMAKHFGEALSAAVEEAHRSKLGLILPKG